MIDCYVILIFLFCLYFAESNSTISAQTHYNKSKHSGPVVTQAAPAAATTAPAVVPAAAATTVAPPTSGVNKMKDRSTPAASPAASQQSYVPATPPIVDAAPSATKAINPIDSSAPAALQTLTDAPAATQTDAVASKSDRNKNLINNDSKTTLDNNYTNSNPISSSSSSQQPEQLQTELKNVANKQSTIAADDDKDSIGNSSSFSSNCLPAKGPSADETDRSTESNLDSDLNIKNNNNIVQSKKPISNTTSTSSISSSAGTRGPEGDSVPTNFENTKESQVTAVSTTATEISPLADVNNGSIESLNNNNTQNVVIDKDLDNNDVINSAESVTAPIGDVSEISEELAAKLALMGISKASPTNQTQPTVPVKSAASKSQTLLNYEEGQWSPENADGRKFYLREQLVTLRDAPSSIQAPKIPDQFQLFVKKNFCMPSFATGNKNQSSSNMRNTLFKRPSTQGQQMQQGQGGGKGSKTGMIHVSLSLREDVKLNESANAWKPTFLSGVAQVAEPNETEVLCKKVRGILNKLTPEKFEPLLEQIQALNIDTTEKLSHVINLVFEKAIDEPNFSAAYAMLCKNLTKPLEDKEAEDKVRKDKEDSERKIAGEKVEPSPPAQAPTFKKELLNKCQKEFDHNVADENAIQSKLTHITNDMNNASETNRKMELRAQLDEEERKLRRRSVGTVRFIGELYRQGMLTTNIMEWCITTLLTTRTEEKLECLCKLLTTVGHKMEEKTGDATVDKKHYRDLTPHFQTMQNIADNKKHPKISSRVRFMLLDVIELRKSKWVSRRNDFNPKTMGQIQKEAEQEQYNKQILNSYGSMGGGNSGSGMGGNNKRNDNRGNDRNDRNDRGSLRNDSRSGSNSGGGYGMNNNNSNKSNRGGGYADTDGWTQAGNKGRGGNNNSTSIDPTKFKGKAVSTFFFKFSSGTRVACVR